MAISDCEERSLNLLGRTVAWTVGPGPAESPGEPGTHPSTWRSVPFMSRLILPKQMAECNFADAITATAIPVTRDLVEQASN